jgi:hypothetical protein
MRVIIAGSRSIKNYDIVEKAVRDSGFEITQIISGGAGGVDELGEQFAARYNIPISYFLANWVAYGRSAGMIRNTDMAKNADALIAIWDGKSVGTKDMIDKANHVGIPVKTTVVNKFEARKK